MGDPSVLRSRSWRWLQMRILGLCSRPAINHDASGWPIPVNRVQARLFGPGRDSTDQIEEDA